jgi:hypothetical protein
LGLPSLTPPTTNSLTPLKVYVFGALQKVKPDSLSFEVLFTLGLGIQGMLIFYLYGARF